MENEPEILFEWTCPKRIKSDFHKTIKRGIKASLPILLLTVVLELIIYAAIKLFLPIDIDMIWENLFIIFFAGAVFIVLIIFFIAPLIENFLSKTKYCINDKVIYIANRPLSWDKITGFWHTPLNSYPSITVVLLFTKDYCTKLFLPKDSSSEAILETFLQRVPLLEDPDKPFEHQRLSKLQHFFMWCCSVIYATIAIGVLVFLKDIPSKDFLFFLVLFFFAIMAFCGPGTICSLFLFPKHQRNTMGKKSYARHLICSYNLITILLFLVSGTAVTIYYLGELFSK